MDIHRVIREGRAQVEWADLVSEHDGHRLVMRVFRDAMKVDGIRVAVTARQMQEVADLTACMLPTAKILDLVWMQASTRFDPIINHGGEIVANLTPEIVSPLIDEKIAKAGDAGGIIESVGKYWVVTNRLLFSTPFGRRTACNYGWHSSKGRFQGVTPGIKLWQDQGCRHNDAHVDPSQVVRLVSRSAMLTRPGSTPIEVDLHDVARDPKLAPLINHDGVLRVLRQPSVPEPQAITNADGSVTLPEIVLI